MPSEMAEAPIPGANDLGSDDAKILIQVTSNGWHTGIVVARARLPAGTIPEAGDFPHKGTVYFHWTTILLPARIIEYIVVHELAHIHERHHTPEFWQRVERTMPDYETRKRWLGEHGMAFVAL